MSSTPRTERSDADRSEELAGLSTTMMRHARRIQQALGSEDTEGRPRLSVVPGMVDSSEAAGIRSAEIRRIAAYAKAHRRRDLLFSPGLFGDPAWDMLLDMFIAQGEARQVTMDSVCLAAGVPASTAWRKFAALEEAGLVARQPDPEDRRRTHVELTSLAIERIRYWLNQLGDWGPETKGLDG